MHNSQLLPTSAMLVPLKYGDNIGALGERLRPEGVTLNSQLLTLNSQFSRVLVAPLNWGLGHATRCVPIISELLRQGKEVVIAAEGYPLRFLRREFPHLEWVEFKGLKVEYSDGQSQVGAMLRQLPQFLRDILREHKELKKIVERYDIDRKSVV